MASIYCLAVARNKHRKVEMRVRAMEARRDQPLPLSRARLIYQTPKKNQQRLAEKEEENDKEEGTRKQMRKKKRLDLLSLIFLPPLPIHDAFQRNVDK